MKSRSALPALGDFSCLEPGTAYNVGMVEQTATSRLAVLKEVFWRPAVGLVATLDALFTLFSAYRYTVFANLTFKWKIIEWVFSWRWQTWLALWSLVWIIVILQGAVSAVRSRECNINTLKGKQGTLASEKTTAEAHSAELEQALETLTAQHRDLQVEYEAAKCELEKLREPPASFSLGTLPDGDPLIVLDEEHGQPRTRRVRAQAVVATIKKHTPPIIEITDVLLQSPHDSPAQNREFARYCPLTGEAGQIDVTQFILQTLSDSNNVMLESVRARSATLRIGFRYSSASRSDALGPQHYKINTKIMQDRLQIELAPFRAS